MPAGCQWSIWAYGIYIFGIAIAIVTLETSSIS